MSHDVEFDDDDDSKYKYESPKEKWEREHDTGMHAGICPRCGSKIFQSTYADSCMCGESDYSY